MNECKSSRKDPVGSMEADAKRAPMAQWGKGGASHKDDKRPLDLVSNVKNFNKKLPTD